MFSKNHCDIPQKSCAVNVALSPQTMLVQLALPIDPRDTIKARRERAIRRSGLTPSKGFRVWYGIADLWRDEYLELRARYERHILSLERTLAQESETLKALREARELRENNYALDLNPKAHTRAVDATDDAGRDKPPQ